MGSGVRGWSFPEPVPGRAHREEQVAAGCRFKLGNKGGVREEKKQSLTEPQLHLGTNNGLSASGRTSHR